MRILGLVEGDRSTALSGAANGLLSALEATGDLVGTIDYSPRPVAAGILAAATIRANRARWRARYHTSLLAHTTLSHTLRRRLREAPAHDLVLQVHGWVQGQPSPYALYVDQTRLMAERGWPEWMPITNRERRRILELERAMYHSAAHVLAMGDAARDSLIEDYELDGSAVTVVGGGLNFDSMPARAGRVSEPTIAFVGRDFERKGGDVLLRAFRRLRSQIPAATLHIVGPERRFAGDGVVNHGKVSDRDWMSHLYRRSRVFCMPSRYEPYGFTFAEAMAHGVPCVGTTVQSIPEILAHGEAGLLVPPGDEAALADALERLLSDDGMARAMGAAGRRHVERELNWRRVVERAQPALRRAAGGQLPGRTSPAAGG